MGLTFNTATSEDINDIVLLINSAYRPLGGIGGWTNETHLVAGARTDPEQLYFLANNPSTRVITAHDASGTLVGATYVAVDGARAHIGMLAIHPDHQSKGYGNALLQYAEKFASDTFNVMQVASLIVSERPEITNLIQKRNYVFTGQTMPYPIDAGVGIPKSDNLELHLYIKNLTTDL